MTGRGAGSQAQRPACLSPPPPDNTAASGFSAKSRAGHPRRAWSGRSGQIIDGRRRGRTLRRAAEGAARPPLAPNQLPERPGHIGSCGRRGRAAAVVAVRPRRLARSGHGGWRGWAAAARPRRGLDCGGRTVAVKPRRSDRGSWAAAAWARDRAVADRPWRSDRSGQIAAAGPQRLARSGHGGQVAATRSQRPTRSDRRSARPAGPARPPRSSKNGGRAVGLHAAPFSHAGWRAPPPSSR